METVEEKLLRQRSKLLGYIESKVGDHDTAEDVLQDGLLRAIRSAGTLHDEEKLLPWFYRILNHAIIDIYRKRGTEERYLETYARGEDLERITEADEAVLCDCFREILPSMKPEYRELLEALDLSEGDPERVALTLNISRNNLKVRRHRARQALRERLEETCRVCAVHGCLDCTCQKR